VPPGVFWKVIASVLYDCERAGRKEESRKTTDREDQALYAEVLCRRALLRVPDGERRALRVAIRDALAHYKVTRTEIIRPAGYFNCGSAGHVH
jgi:hypothetical protein